VAATDRQTVATVRTDSSVSDNGQCPTEYTQPVYFTPFKFSAPCQFTPLLNLHPPVLFNALRRASLLRHLLIYDGNFICDLRLIFQERTARNNKALGVVV
jgi:hypothetical protein